MVYDPALTKPDVLAKRIAAVGFKVERVAPTPTRRTTTKPERVKARLPDDAPEFFRTAFEQARRKQRPMVIDFHATWCVPCKRLKKETLGAPTVAKLLEQVELIHVDVDRNPDLAKAFDVRSVPNVLFINRGGYIIDRLGNFEPPAAFRDRLRRLLAD